jgi:hypothetical protein
VPAEQGEVARPAEALGEPLVAELVVEDPGAAVAGRDDDVRGEGREADQRDADGGSAAARREAREPQPVAGRALRPERAQDQGVLVA